ncbi:SIMPL domain-containing protein [Nonomuraea ferruginea]
MDITADITVIGEGAADAVPDVMRLHTGVEVRRQSAAEAFAGARAAAARLAEALRGGRRRGPRPAHHRAVARPRVRGVPQGVGLPGGAGRGGGGPRPGASRPCHRHGGRRGGRRPG